MAVTDAVKQPESADFTKDETTFNETWRATTDNPQDDGFLVASSPLLPQPGQSHSGFPNARVAQISPSRVSGQFTHWDVTIRYSSYVSEHDNPLNRPPDISVGGDLFESPMYIDMDGKAVVNSPNDPYDPPDMRDDSRDTITIVENVAAYDFQTQRLYRNAVNSDVFSINYPGLTGTIFPPGLAKMQTFSGHGVVESGMAFWKRTLKIELKEEGWLARLLDQGFHYIVEEDVGHPTRQITAVNNFPPAPHFTVAGDVTNSVSVGDTFKVVGSPDDGTPNNDGDYTVAIVTDFDSNTIIAPVAAIPSKAVGGVAMFNVTQEKVPKPIKVDGHEVKQPVLLDGHGYPMVVGYQSFQPTPADAEFREFRRYRTMPFRMLGQF